MAILSKEKSPIAFRGFTVLDGETVKLLTFDKQGKIHTFSIEADFGKDRDTDFAGNYLVY